MCMAHQSEACNHSRFNEALTGSGVQDQCQVMYIHRDRHPWLSMCFESLACETQGMPGSGPLAIPVPGDSLVSDTLECRIPDRNAG
jgi:hypothetical protein